MRSLKFVLLKAYIFCLKKPKWVLAVFLCLIFFAFYQLQFIELALSADSIKHENITSAINYNKLLATFPEQKKISIFIDPKTHLTDKRQCEIYRMLNDFRDNPYVSSVFSVYDMRKTTMDIDHLWYPNIVPNPCEQENVENQLNLIQATPWKALSAPEAKSDLFAEIELTEFNSQTVKDIMQKTKTVAGDESTYFYGSAVYEYHNLETSKNSQWMNLAALLLIMVFFTYLFSNWFIAACLVFSLLFTNILVHGGMAFFKHTYDFLSMSVFLISIISTIEDFVYLSTNSVSHKNWKTGFRKLLLPSFLTSLTTMIGFGALMTSRSHSIVKFGFWTMMAAFIEWGICFLIMPSLFTIFPKLQKLWSFRFYKRTEPKFLKAKISWKYLKYTLLILFITPIAFLNLSTSSSPLDAFKANHPFTIGKNYLTQTRNWISTLTFVWPKTIDDKQIQTILEKIKKDPEVRAIESSIDVQSYLSQNNANPMMSLRIESDFKSSSFSDRYISADGKSKRAYIYIKSADIKTVNLIYHEIEKICATDLNQQCYATSDLVMFAEYATILLDTLYSSFCYSVFLVIIVLVWLARSLKQKGIFRVIASSMWGACCVVCLMYVMRVPVTVVSSVVLAILTGITGDNAIQYLLTNQGRGQLSDRVEHQAQATWICLASMIVISSLFLFSEYRDFLTLGLLMIAGFVLCAFGDYFILKSWTEKKDKS